MTVQLANKEISKNTLKLYRKFSHFALFVISKYVIPPTATKDVYFIYDISNLEQFKGDLESGELVNYKKMAIYGNNMNSF